MHIRDLHGITDRRITGVKTAVMERVLTSTAVETVRRTSVCKLRLNLGNGDNFSSTYYRGSGGDGDKALCARREWG